ncbi:MAG: pimelyl-ACP methyl ester esterase BioV [Arcobacteraceae bacterium]
MKLYFSGFSLQNEEGLFQEYLETSDFVVSGFSFGAIKAVEYVLETTKRVDKLQLFSPAYFNDKEKKYKRMQLLYFTKDSAQYCEQFLQNVGFSKELASEYFEQGTYAELEELLEYFWDEKKLQKIVDKNIKIEVFLGANDKIIDASKALEFFKQFAEVYYIKNKGHIL